MKYLDRSRRPLRVERALEERARRQRGALPRLEAAGSGIARQDKIRGSGDRWGGDMEVEAMLAEAGLAPSPHVRHRPSAAASAQEVLQPMYRRTAPVSGGGDTGAGPSMMRRTRFSAGIHLVLYRLLVWFLAVGRLLLADLLDTLLRRYSTERRAVRLRLMFERMGGTAIKFGQQLAIRIDLLPYAYAFELSKLLDKVKPFPTEQAQAVIERTTGRKLEEIFASFDPRPIGSGSVACVFQAALLSGERVAVKVRRPGIGVLFAADCRALAWVLTLLEGLTVLRAGLTANLVTEFRDILMDELDFVKEARSAELFERGLRKARIDGVRAPRILFDLSSEEVLVMEHVTGIFASEIIAGIETKDQALLDLLDRFAIEPKRLASRLLRTNHYCMFENLVFHCDPHPANILVRPGGEIVLLDFGSCGSYTDRERHIWRQLVQAHRRHDVAQMAQAALALIEPLPPIDIDKFTKQVEQVFWQDLYAFRSKHSEWWERTSAHIWISFMELTRSYAIPMNLNILRMIRSTLLYETVAARLRPDISSYHEHHMYSIGAGKRARKRIRREARRTLRRGVDPRFWLRVEQLRLMGGRAIDMAQRILDSNPVRYLSLMGKAAYLFSQTVGITLWLALPTLILMGGVELHAWYVMESSLLSPREALETVVTNPAWLLWAGFMSLLTLRRVVTRLRDPEGA